MANIDLLTFLLPKYSYFFFYLGFLSPSFIIQKTAGNGGDTALTSNCHFHWLHRQLYISRLIAAERSTVKQIQNNNFWFPSANH